MKNSISAVILAAGKGTRIGQHLPKVLYPIVGRPMIHYTLDLLRQVPIKHKVVVVGFRAVDVMGSIRDSDVDFVEQKEQLGTAHALKLVLPKLKGVEKDIIVLNGDDSAFFETSTVRDFIKSHNDSNAELSIMTARVDNPFGLGRVIRDKDGAVTKIVEEKFADDNQKNVNEVNTGCYIFNRTWVERSIQSVKKNNSGEFYITDLVAIALKESFKVNTFVLKNTDEWLGINTQDQLASANERMLKKIGKSDSKKPVFIFDLDNTLLDTDSIKKFVNNDIVPAALGEDADAFWEEYEKVRGQLGFVSIPDFADSLSIRLGDAEMSNKIRKIFFEIPFNKFVEKDAIKLLTAVSENGGVVVLSEGDLVYQPIKIKKSGISEYVSEAYVFENKNNNIPKMMDIYGERKKIVVDDKITCLERFKEVDGDCITIHVKVGSYKDLAPLNSNFKADYTVSSLGEILTNLDQIISST